MKTITINVREPVYEDFQRASKALGRPTAALGSARAGSWRMQMLLRPDEGGQRKGEGQKSQYNENQPCPAVPSQNANMTPAPQAIDVGSPCKR